MLLTAKKTDKCRSVTAYVCCAVVSLAFSHWATAQVQSLAIEPASTAPTIEVANDGNSYTSMVTEGLDFPVKLSARCRANSRIETYYLITNTSEADFTNNVIRGTIGVGELGYMLPFRPTGSAAVLSEHNRVFKVPTDELFAGDDPVPVKTCNELLKRRIKKGTAKTAVLAKDMKVLQPLSLSFMPSCVTNNATYWSKQTTSLLLNYVCKASEVAIAADKKRLAAEAKRKAQATKDSQQRRRTAARPEPKKPVAKVKAKTDKPAKVVVAAAKPTVLEVKPVPQPKAAVASESAAAKAGPKLSVVAIPSEYSGECPALIAFKGKITSTEKGLIKFHFEDSGRAEATRAVMFKNKDHTQSFQTQTLFEESKSGSVKLVVEGPQSGQAETTYAVICKN